jgi:thiamine biosynthesis lipoprotein
MSLAAPRPAPSLAAASGPGRGAFWALRRLRIALGTWVAVEAVADTEAIASAALEAAFAAVSEVGRRMHPSGEASDLARISSAALGVRAALNPSTWEVLRLAQRVHFHSDGVFDPSLPVRPGCLTDLELSPESAPDPPWALCRAPLALDLGGIAKGYAVDRAVEALIAAGCTAGLVNAGGDLRLFGALRDTFLLRHADGSCEPLVLGSVALAVSDADARQRPAEHRGYYQRSGARRLTCRYAAVLAPTAALADALTKCVLLAPTECAQRTLRALGGRQVR